MIRTLTEFSIPPASELRLVNKPSSSEQRVDRIIMLSSESPGQASPTDEAAKKPLSEAAMRQEMIESELNGMVDEMMNSEDFEEQDEMEKKAYDALMKAAKEICCLRKYYDISADKVVYFPSVSKTLVNYDLTEKAATYYGDEDDEFPSLYGMGLRQVALDRIKPEGGDDENEEMDDDMIERLSMPVQLSEDEPDPLVEAAAAAEYAQDKEKENRNSDPADLNLPKPPLSSDRTKPSAINSHQPRKAPDTRTIRFAKQQRIKPISNSFLASGKIRSLLWHPVEELEERAKHWKKGTPTEEILDREEGSFLLQMLDCCNMEAPQEDDWSPQREKRVQAAINAVLKEQDRQNRQQERIRERFKRHNIIIPPNKKRSSLSLNQHVSVIGITKEEKDRLSNQDQTPMFMIALQYCWHAGRASEKANNRAIQLAMEIKRLWQEDEIPLLPVIGEELRFGSNSEHELPGEREEEQQGVKQNEIEEKKEDKEARKEPAEFYDDDEDDGNDVVEVPLNDENPSAPSAPRPPPLVSRMSDHSAFSDLRDLQKRGSSRSFLNDSRDSLLHPEAYLGDKVHLVLPSKVIGKEHPRISAMLKKQRSRARLSLRGSSLKEDIQVSGTKLMKQNVLKDINGRDNILAGKKARKAFFQSSVKKLITLNRFFQQVEGISKDRALDADKKKFLAAIAAKKSSVFQSMEIPANLHVREEVKQPINKNPIHVESILLTPATKALRPKRKVVWGAKLHRVKFFPEFPVEGEKEKYFYSSEDISRFRFEKFMEDRNDEYEEEVVESDDEGSVLQALDEEKDDDEYSYEELSYHSEHSESEESYYEEEVVVQPARDFASRFLAESESTGSEERRLSL